MTSNVAVASEIVNLVMRKGSAHPTDSRASYFDLYEFDDLDLSSVAGLVVTSDCDQIFLERKGDELTAFVRAGGRIAVMGHVVTEFLEGISRWQKIQYSGPKDLEITIGEPHSVWDGVDPADLTTRKEVSGFYARGYPQKLPDGAVVTTHIGRSRVPLDYVYPLGEGHVLVHSGNDLTGWHSDDNSASRMSPQLFDWLVQR
ncbi:hypothetical protein [Rhodococcus sp. ARC_M6]|uniref:hypothetical protein n=1 Tax=Rhodococcus sp. ARC_M6 TaxID=2928852 RepID=UPI001FB45F39|nr:hypothetical protein [Rhodococcus sp. ARC_M6]MCJ0907449.1 hypothetical protein [Rhodococcus sp. ARC_M6]